MNERDEGFAAGWAAAIERIDAESLHFTEGDAKQRFAIFLARLWWNAADPKCLACKGRGYVLIPPREHRCVPVGTIDICGLCEKRFHPLMPYHAHLNPGAVHSEKS